MKIATKVIFDIETGALLEKHEHDYIGSIEFCGRDSTGKKQETGQLDANNARRGEDYANRAKSLGKYDASVDALEANPGYRPEDLQAMRSENADLEHSLYGDEAEQVRRNSAMTGYGNDAGLMPALESITDARGRSTALGQNDISRIQGNAVLDTRRMLPSMRFQPAQLYQGDIGNLTSSNTALINGRQQADQTTPLWAQMAMTGMQAAGQSATGNLGCWIAEAIYGVNDSRTHLLRSWLNDEFQQTIFGRIVMRFYLKFGERIAEHVKRSTLLRSILRPLFNLALSQAHHDRGMQWLKA